MFNGKGINLLKSIALKFQDRFEARHMMESQPLLFHLKLKQGFTRVTLTSADSQTENA